MLYPYLTGLVAGAFILASLERVFNVKALQPIYRLSLLTALAFLFVASLPLLAHLGHPERSFEMFLTPQLKSAMAMFGFVYAWYLMVVLLLEIWFDYRKDVVVWSSERKGLMKYFYWIFSLGVTDLSQKSLKFDNKIGKIITMIGIPSAFLLHGSARSLINMPCLNKLAEFLIYAMIVDFSLELLDFIHRLYQSEESINILSQMIHSRLFISLIISQIVIGSVVPLISLLWARFGKIPDEMRRMTYFIAAILVQIGIFSTRWNVVVGGQLFSKSLRGLTVYKLELFGLEGIMMSGFLLILPLIILYVIAKILPPWPDTEFKITPS